MTDLQSTAKALRTSLLKEISGFITLLGKDIDSNNEQQANPVMKHFGTEDAKFINIEDFGAMDSNIQTSQLKRLIAFNGEPDKLMAVSHTWSKLDHINFEDLLTIHLALEERVNIILHRS